MLIHVYIHTGQKLIYKNRKFADSDVTQSSTNLSDEFVCRYLVTSSHTSKANSSTSHVNYSTSGVKRS